MTDKTLPPHVVRVDNGKYTFIKRRGDQPIEILRHGEPWHTQHQAWNALARIMAELDAARVVLKTVRYALEHWNLSTRGLLDVAMAAHRSLVDDRELPSDRCATPAIEREVERKPDPAASGGRIGCPHCRDSGAPCHDCGTLCFPRVPGKLTRRHTEDVPLAVEHGLALTAADIVLADIDNGWRKLNPADVERMAHVVRWALKRTDGGAEPRDAPAFDGAILKCPNPHCGKPTHATRGDTWVRMTCGECYQGFDKVVWLTGPDVYSVNAYGAKGDGATDDRPAVAAAIAAATPYANPRASLVLRARQWAIAERASDDRQAELELAAEKAATREEGAVRPVAALVAYTEAQARARVAGRVEGETFDWLKEAARALIDTPEATPAVSRNKAIADTIAKSAETVFRSYSNPFPFLSDGATALAREIGNNASMAVLLMIDDEQP